MPRASKKAIDPRVQGVREYHELLAQSTLLDDNVKYVLRIIAEAYELSLKK